MDARPLRVLIASASIGAGHVAAGRALDSAFTRLGAQTLHVDLLDYTTAPFRRLYRQAYFDLVRSAPDLVDWLGKRLDRGPSGIRSGVRSRDLRLRARLTRLISYHLPRTLATYRPDLLVHTHFLPPEVLSTAGGRVPVPQCVVITDFAAHRLWIQPRMSRFFVAAEEVRAHLQSLSVPHASISVTGIPIDLRFRDLPSRAEARASLGIAEDRDVLLIMAGGLGPQVFDALLAGLRDLRLHLQVVVVCGRSPDLVRRAHASLSLGEGPVRFEILGFSDRVPDLMAACDLVLGKPGGLTTSEALAAGRPFAVVDPYPLQEEANANYLLEHGAGMRIDPLSTLELKLARFYGDRERRNAMSASAHALGRPNAALLIAEELLAAYSPLPERRR